MFLDSVTNELVRSSLDLIWKNHSVIANNVANVNTEGYQALKVDFESALSTVTSLVDSQASDASVRTALKSVDQSNWVGVDLASERVALDEQMVELTKNSLRYQALLNARSQMSSIVGVAIHGGQR